MLNNLQALLRDDEGATLVEYSLVVALIAGVAISILTTLGGSIKNLFTTVNTSVGSASDNVGK